MCHNDSCLPEWPSLPVMLEQNAARLGAQAALLSDGDEPLSHQQLWEQGALAVPVTNCLGVGRGEAGGVFSPPGASPGSDFSGGRGGGDSRASQSGLWRKGVRVLLERL